MGAEYDRAGRFGLVFRRNARIYFDDASTPSRWAGCWTAWSRAGTSFRGTLKAWRG